MPKSIALIPARAGSLRVKSKNTRPLDGHPLIAYTIQVAIDSGLFDRIIVSTDSRLTQKIANWYGAETPFLRPSEFATSTSPDIEWIKHALNSLDESYDIFSILRPTSPFRTADTLQRAFNDFKLAKTDSIRAVELCHEHPGKMWTIGKDKRLQPLLAQEHLEVPYHARQYQDMPTVYVQNSSLEIAWTHVVYECNSREGKSIAPFFSEGSEGFSIDYEIDWTIAQLLIKRGDATLPTISLPQFQNKEHA